VNPTYDIIINMINPPINEAPICSYMKNMLKRRTGGPDDKPSILSIASKILSVSTMSRLTRSPGEYSVVLRRLNFRTFSKRAESIAVIIFVARICNLTLIWTCKIVEINFVMIRTKIIKKTFK